MTEETEKKEIEIIWVTKRGTQPYKKEFCKDIWNFLFWEGKAGEKSLLIAGNGIYISGDATFDALLSCYRQYGNRVPNRNPDGAGKRPGSFGIGISKWDSMDLGITTPERLRPIIREALGF